MKRSKKSAGSPFYRMGLLFEGLLVVFAFGALVDLLRRLFGLGKDPGAWGFLGYALVLSLLVVLGVFGGLRLRRENFRDLGFSRERYAPALALALGVGAGLLVAALGFGMELAFGMLDLPVPAPAVEVTGTFSYVLFALSGFLVAGLCEELVFRGYALRRLEAALAKGGKARQGTLWAVLLLSALYGLAQMDQGWTGQLEAGVFSLALFGVYFVAKRDLGVVIAAHGTLQAILFWFAWLAS